MSEQKKIGLAVAVVIGLNAMIGAGIVAIPSVLASSAGPAGILSFLFSVFVVLCMSLSLGKLAERHPGEGWTYLYPEKLGGHWLGMAASLSYLIAVIVAMGFVTQQAGVWAGYFIPQISPQILATIILVILMLLVLWGAEASTIGQYVIAAVVLGSLLLSAGVCALHWDMDLLTPFAPQGMRAVVMTAPKAMFSLLGFESIASLYSILKNPTRNVRRASMIAVLCVGGLYAFFIFSIIATIPSSYFERGTDIALAAILKEFLPQYPFLTLFILLGGLFAILGTLHSMIWSINLLMYSTLERGKSRFVKSLLAGPLYRDKHGVLLTSALILATSWFLHSEMIFNLTVVLIAFAYVSSISLLFKDREQWRSGGNILTILAVMGGLTLMYLSVAPYLGIG